MTNSKTQTNKEKTDKGEHNNQTSQWQEEDVKHRKPTEGCAAVAMGTAMKIGSTR